MKHNQDSHHHSLSIEAVDTLEQVNGKFLGARRAHAKGQIYDATFTPNGNAKPYTIAVHLQNEDVPATVRFSNSSTNPLSADILSPVKGMAVQFQLPQGETSNLVAVSISMFVAKTPESFIDMIKILTADKTNIEKLDKGLAIKEVIRKYPESARALLALKELTEQPPVSFSALYYYPIHTFYFVNEEGKRQAVKYEWHPHQELTDLTKQEVKATSPDYLSEELESRLEKGPVTFNLVIQLGETGDNTDDPTEVWPTERQKIIVGQLTIKNKQENPKKDLLFDPTIVSKGIELSKDPILNFRHDAYAVSLERRMKNE